MKTHILNENAKNARRKRERPKDQNQEIPRNLTLNLQKSAKKHSCTQMSGYNSQRY